MSKKSTSIPAGIALLAGLSAQAQNQEIPQAQEEKVEVAADLIEEMIVEGQIIMNNSGTMRLNKGLFDVLRERGILKDKEIQKSTDTNGDGPLKCRMM